MSFDETHPTVRQMLAELYRRTGRDPSAKASMYDLGQAAGLDRSAAQEAGQALIGAGLAAIVSLSGSIRITAEGIAQVEAEDGPPGQAAVRLGTGPILEAQAREAVESAAALIKGQLGRRGWPFDLLGEVGADLRTIEAQLQSPRPKTAVVRACLQSLTSALSRVEARDLQDPLAGLLGD